VDGNSQLEQPLHYPLGSEGQLFSNFLWVRVLHDCHYQATLLINWLPQILKICGKRYSQSGLSGLDVRSPHCPVNLPRRLWQYLVARVGIGAEDRWDYLTKP